MRQVLTISHQAIFAAFLLIAVACESRAQAAPAVLSALPDSTTLANRGAQDAIRAAKQISARGAFIRGMASGPLGPLLGLVVMVPAAKRPVVIEAEQRALMADTSLAYRQAFEQGVVKRVQGKRFGAALMGNLIIAIPLYYGLLGGFSDSP